MRHLTVAVALLIAGTAGAGEMVIVSDDELDNVYAQSGEGVINTLVENITDPSMLEGATIVAFPETFSMNGQVIVSDNAQQNAFNPVNAANSAVSNVYNIFVVIESTWENVTVNLNNEVDTTNASNVMGATY